MKSVFTTQVNTADGQQVTKAVLGQPGVNGDLAMTVALNAAIAAAGAGAIGQGAALVADVTAEATGGVGALSLFSVLIRPTNNFPAAPQYVLARPATNPAVSAICRALGMVGEVDVQSITRMTDVDIDATV
jgi:hypothetical protein